MDDPRVETQNITTTIKTTQMTDLSRSGTQYIKLSIMVLNVNTSNNVLSAGGGVSI